MLMTALCIPQANAFPSTWFYNTFALNPENCPFILLRVDDSLQASMVCGDQILKNTKQEEVLCVTLDNKLNFATHLLNISKNAN